VTAEAEPKVYRSANNIPGVKTATVGTLNVYDILNGGKFIAPKNAIAKIEEVYA
jgi:large subunit ribosomal protein L4